MIAVFATLLLQATPVPPVPPVLDMGFLTAQSLADRCNASSAAETSYCYAYITGIHDTMRAYEIWLNLKEFCPPIGVTQGELRRTVLGYLVAYPDNRHGQAASVVVVALKTAYPCIDPAAQPLPPPAPSRAPSPAPSPKR